MRLPRVGHGVEQLSKGLNIAGLGGAQRGSVADNFQAILFLDPSLVSGLTGTGLTSAGLGSNAGSVFSSVSIGAKA